MISNQEFIKTQAYEISWAVFRCAELFSQSKLREEVESAAIDLIAESDFLRVEKLTSLIRLAESVGQIAAINANVLYRELDNLTRAIGVNIAEDQKKGNITASLEQIFTNPAYAESLTTSTPPVNPAVNSVSVPSVIPAEAGIQHSPKQAVAANPVIRQNNANQFGSIESLNAFLQTPSAPVIPSLPRDLKSEFGKADSSTPQGTAPLGMTRTALVRQVQTAPAGSWQYVILQKVKDLGQTTTKELTTSFPEISERTIRFYLQKLVDSGSIDRIGSTGPGSAYRAK